MWLAQVLDSTVDDIRCMHFVRWDALEWFALRSHLRRSKNNFERFTPEPGIKLGQKLLSPWVCAWQSRQSESAHYPFEFRERGSGLLSGGRSYVPGFWLSRYRWMTFKPAIPSEYLEVRVLLAKLAMAIASSRSWAFGRRQRESYLHNFGRTQQSLTWFGR